MQQKKNRKRLAITVALVACLAAVAGLGTLAWLTAQDSKANEFTVGNFGTTEEPPKTDNDETGEPEDKDPDEGNITTEVGGYLFETAWDDPSNDHKLAQGVAVPKNPNVGIKEGKDDAFVFLYVVNDTVDSAKLDSEAGQTLNNTMPYFDIEDEWAVVKNGEQECAMHSTATGHESAYTSGLFMYTTSSTGVEKSLPQALIANETGVIAGSGEDVYTGELFADVTVPEGVSMDIFKTGAGTEPTITVYAYLYGYDADAGDGEDGSAQAAMADAIEWAKTKGLQL